MSEINDIVELPRGIYFLKITDKYQRKDPILMAKYNNHMYNTHSPCGGINMNFKLITCED